MRNEPEPREGIVESRTPSPVKMRTAPPPPYELCGLPQDYIRTVVATYSYIAADEDELSFTKGEQILVVKHPQPEEQVFNLKLLFFFKCQKPKFLNVLFWAFLSF